MHVLTAGLLVIAAAGTIASSIYLVLVLLAVQRFNTAAAPESQFPPISVLKPLHGLEPGLEHNLKSFFEQDYPSFEIVFGVRALSDPALAAVKRLSTQFPGVRVKVVAGGEPAWPSARAWSVHRMIPEAAFGVLAITDSDVRVGPDFLKRVHAPLSSAGLVTCLYRGLPLGGFWSRMEALGMSVELMSGVLVANMLEGMKFALGPATATTKQALEAIGGMEDPGQHFADDFVLGSRMAASGQGVFLSDYVVEHAVPPYSLLESFRHQLLWAKSSRFSRPWGHIGTGLTFAMPYAILGAAVSHGWFALAWVVLGAANRILQCRAAGWGVVRDPRAKRLCWLYPVRDLLGWFVWTGSFFGRTVYFRGRKYRLTKSGRLMPID